MRIIFVLASLLVAIPQAGAGDPGGRPLLVTIDDLPVAGGRLHRDPEERERITAALLAVLEKHDVPAVGFVIWGGVRDAADERLLERWLEAGHELGNHTAGHPDPSRTGVEAYIADVESGRSGLATFLGRTGRTVRWFRFPFLREGGTLDTLRRVRTYLERSGQRTVPVTIDNQDWSFEEPWVEARRRGDREAWTRIGEDYQLALRSEVLAQTALGDELFERPVPQVLLLHANEIGTVEWDGLFEWLVARGFRFASADEVMADPALSAPHEYVGGFGPSLWYRLQRELHSTAVREQVGALLDEQARAWSRGDIAAFCAGYAPDAVFVSPSGITRGRDEVEARYRARYPTTEAMGELTLELLDLRQAWGTEVTLLGDAVPSRTHGVSVVARWTLRSADGTTRSGVTLMVLERSAGRWRVVQDASM